MCSVCSVKSVFQGVDFGTDIFLRADARSFACVSPLHFFVFPFVISGACLAWGFFPLITVQKGGWCSPRPAEGEDHAGLILNRETRGVSASFWVRFFLIVRLVREVIKVVRDMLARTFLRGFWVEKRRLFFRVFVVVAKGEGAGEKRSFEPLARHLGVRSD